MVNGKRAKRNEVLQAFDLEDLDAVRRLYLSIVSRAFLFKLFLQVLRVILSKGEFQLNEEEREHELEAMFRDVSCSRRLWTICHRFSQSDILCMSAPLSCRSVSIRLPASLSPLELSSARSARCISRCIWLNPPSSRHSRLLKS